MTQPNRLPQGFHVDLGRPLEFTFNGKNYTGFQGDTLASALLANGVRLVGRSFKYHRPRGIVGSGVEEPNALVQLGTGAQTLPNYVATQIELYDGLEASSVNCWPSVGFDLRAVNGLISRFLPPGFYYKTFMWPRSFWPLYERQLRKAGGLGVAPTEPDTDRYDKMNAHCDVLVVGSGPAGVAAALEAGRAGARVILVDEQQELGGSLLASRRTIGSEWAGDWLEAALAELRGMDEVRILPRSTAFGYYDHNFVAVLERVTDHLGPTAGYAPRQRIWRIRAKQVVLATGAIERPLVFRNNDRPGVMLASAVSTYVLRYGVAPGRRAVLFVNNDNAYVTVLDLFDAGVDVEAVVDLRPQPDGELPRKVAALEIEVLTGSALVDVHGGKGVVAVDVMRVDGGSAVGEPRRIECDLVAVSGGWNPTLNLHSQSGGQPRFDDALSCFVPGPPVQAERSAGSCNAAFTLRESLAQGTAAGAAAAGDAGFGDGRPSAPAPDANDWPGSPYSACWIVPGTKPVTRESKSFVDLQTDTTAADIAVSAREGYEMIEHVKRYTTLGMGTDQGRTGAVNGIGALAEVLGRPIPEIGTTTFRQPYTPVTFGAIAGRDLRELFDPVRKTPMHEWHVRARAEFEDVGQWKRAWYYPRPGESLHEAVDRECLAVRNAVGVLDASTLGKIDVRGPDAADVPGPRLHQRLDKARRRALPLRLHAERRGHGARRRRDGAAFGKTLPDAHHHVRGRHGHGVAGAMAADRVAGPEGVPDVGDRPLGDGVDQRAPRPAGHREDVRRRRPLRRRVPLHVGPQRHRGGRARPDLPHQLRRRAVLRGQRRRRLRAPRLGGRDGGRRGVRHYAVRHGGDARPAGREGLRDRRPGHRRLGHAGRPRRRAHGVAAQGFSRQAVARHGAPGARGPEAARRPAHRRRSGGAARGRTDRRRPVRSRPGANAGPRDFQLLQRQPRSLHCDGHRQGRTKPARAISSTCPSGPGVRSRRGSRARPSTTRKGRSRMSTDGTGRQSPLSAFFATAAGDAADGAAVVISERPFLGHLNLRGDPGDGGFTSAAAGVLGFRLPTEPNTTVGEGGLLALWLGPDEWLVVTPPHAQTSACGLPRRPRSRAYTPRSSM